MLHQTGEWFLEETTSTSPCMWEQQYPFSVSCGVVLVTARKVRAGRTWDPAQLEQSATAQSTETPGKREARRVMGSFNQPCCLAYILSFYFFFWPLSILLKGTSTVLVFHHREGLMWTSGEQGRHWRHKSSCLSGHCSGGDQHCAGVALVEPIVSNLRNICLQLGQYFIF